MDLYKEERSQYEIATIETVIGDGSVNGEKRENAVTIEHFAEGRCRG